MNQKTDTETKRPVILYIIIAILLSAALMLGVWWAKNRANFYAQQSGQVSQPQGLPSPETASQNPVESPVLPPEVGTPNPVATQSEPSSPVVMPATGPEQGLLSIATISLCLFAALSYLRARKRFYIASRFTL